MSKRSSDRPSRQRGLARGETDRLTGRRPKALRATKEDSWKALLATLLIRPVRQSGESFMGHALRVAFDNGFSQQV